MVVRKPAFAQWNPGYIDRHEARGGWNDRTAL